MKFRKLLASALIVMMLLSCLPVSALAAAEQPETALSVRDQLENYNVSWNTPSTGSAGSMPIGNGDITANVWVEQDGSLYFYIGKSDTWSETTRLLKLGKVRVQLTDSQGSAITPGAGFEQTLKLYEGEIDLKIGGVDLRFWIDANNPVIHVDANSETDFQLEVSTEIWRTEKTYVSDFSNLCIRDIPGLSEETWETADVVMDTNDDTVVWYHRNGHSYYQPLVEVQGLTYKEEEDPYLNRTFGACIKGDGLVKKDADTLESENAGKNFSVSVYPYTSQTETIETWKSQLDAQIAGTEETPSGEAYPAHQEWWSGFWNRSYMFITGDSDAETVTLGYIMQRFMEAIQGRGNYAIKFNGGTITVDYAGYNADYRQWGPCYWFQNTRHEYWNMLASGDYDMMLPLFNMYMEALELRKEQTKTFYNHDGAFFPETMTFSGLYSGDDFAWDPGYPDDGDDHETNNTYVRYYWQGGLELSAMMLEYYSYTRDEAFAKDTLVPFAQEIVRFYKEHYPDTDGDGVMDISPAHVLETYWNNVKNPVEVVAGLQCVTEGLLALPEELTTEALRSEWNTLRDALPAIPTQTDTAGNTKLVPAETYGTTTSNQENPELYPVFPYKLYGVGKETDLQTAINTYNSRKFPYAYCWGQDGIQAAYLGLSSEAKRCVISHFSRQAGDVRFPGFWNKGNDWMPDLDNGGSAMMALQAMLLQYDGATNTAQILPAWPSEWKVEFKLHTGNNTVITGSYDGTKLTSLTQEGDGVEVVLSDTADPAAPKEAPQGVTAVPSFDGILIRWNASDNETVNIYRSDKSEPIASNVQGQGYVDTDVEAGKTYTYYAKLVNAIGEGPASAELPVTAAHTEVLFEDNFDSGSISEKWTNRQGGALSEQDKVVQDGKWNWTGAATEFAFVEQDNAAWTDYVMEAEFTFTNGIPSTGNEWACLGLETRAQKGARNSGAYETLYRYLGRLDVLSPGRSLQDRTPIPAPEDGGVYTLRVESIGSTLRAYINGVLIKEYENSESSYGGAGIYIYGNNGVLVDNVAVRQVKEVTTYTVSVAETPGGTVTASLNAAEAGETVTVTVTPEDGYQLKTGSLKANGVEIVNNQFTMPAENVTITAVFELIPIPVDKTALEALVADAKALNEDDYTEETWSGLEAALAAAEAVLADEEATQEEVDAAEEALRAAMAGLKEKSEPEPEVDKSALEELYNANKDRQQGNYTKPSWEAFQEALENAKAVLDDENASQEEVDAAEEALRDAIDGLQKKPTFPVLPIIPGGSNTTKPANEMPFTDVNTGDWFYNDVKYVYENGIMNGVSDTRFAPQSTLTRAMVVTILYRMEGEPATRYNALFPDVTDNQWYTKGVEWAANNGIVLGYTSGKFGPDDPVTREQLAAILYRYAQSKNYVLAEGADLSAYADASNISPYAVTAVQWSVTESLLEGSNGKLLPRQNATRAEVAHAIAGFCQNVK